MTLLPEVEEFTRNIYFEMIKKILFINILLSLVFPAVTLNAQDVEVVITGLRNTKGQIVIGVFKDNETFKIEKSFLEKRFIKKDIKNREMRVHFTIEPGIYGLSLLDDENSNGLMEYNFLGIPKEGFGFSDYYHSGFTKPKFDSFKFTLAKDQTKRITVRIRYM
jgi:uncharacterized protein (DUF2141 family)